MTLASAKDAALSLVIAASNGPSLLERCLDSCTDQAELVEAEIIVVSNYPALAEPLIARRFPRVKHIGLSADATVPELRARGIACAGGEVVALLEDHCTLDARWCSEMIKAHQLPNAVIGGAVENGDGASRLDWAVYFYDYGKYMPPNQAGVTNSLPGNNVSYKRAALGQVGDSIRAGFFETFIHEEMANLGQALYLAPDAIVTLEKRYETMKTLIQSYHQGRSFGARRVSGSNLVKRATLACGSVILPLLLPARVIARTLRKGRRQKELFLCLPYLMLLTAVWSAGEFSGYLMGEGDSAGHWK